MSGSTIGSAGFVLPYKRYLSDASTGILFVVAIGWVFDFKIPTNLEAAVLFGGAMLILSPALGLLFNATSWFLLGYLTILMEWKMADAAFNNRPLWGTAATLEVNQFDEIVKLANIGQNRNEWVSATRKIKVFMDLRNNNVFDNLSYIEGARNLARTISLFFWMTSAIYIIYSWPPNWYLVLALLFGGFIALYISSLMSFYYETTVLHFWHRSRMLDNNVVPVGPG